MSSFTTSAFVASGGYSAETRKHPGMAFIEAANIFFDSRDHTDISDWVTSDFTVQQPNGSTKSGAPQETIDEAKQLYDKVLTSYRHVPTSTIIVDTDDGYKLMSSTFIYANLLAISALNPVKVTGPDGSKWDIAVPGFVEIDIVKDEKAKHNGMLVKHMKFSADQNEISKTLNAKGVVLPSFLHS